MGKKGRKKVVAEIPVEDVAGDVMEVATAEGRNLKRKSAMDSRFALLGSDLSWLNVTPASDSLSVLVGSEEGGFVSLEEIDGDQWNMKGSEVTGESSPDVVIAAEKIVSCRPSKKRKKMKKKKNADCDSVVPGDSDPDTPGSGTDVLEFGTKQTQVTEKSYVSPSKLSDSMRATGKSNVLNIADSEKPSNVIASKKRKKSKLGSRARKELRGKRNGGVGKGNVGDVNFPNDVAGKKSIESDDGELLDMSAWADMRLHSKLERAIQELRFKEPTPIQRQCIPAAAHKGKDVIGAAETGSGKTLAFGLPILQRLLQEQDKAMKQSVLEDSTETAMDTKGERTLGPLRALIITPTRELALQICEHLKAAAKWTNIRVVPIVGGMATQKQERMLKQMPEIVVGTPGRLWELMSDGESHLLELQSLSFFVLDEADRMVEKGHFKELQSIIDILQSTQKNTAGKQTESLDLRGGGGIVDLPPNSRRRRQILVFSATLALPADFKSKLNRGCQMPKTMSRSMDSVAALSERAGVSNEAAIFDLTSSSVVAKKLLESIVQCRDEDKDHYLYYILKVHGGGRAIVFCTSIAALRRILAILRLLQIPVCPLHAQMQQKARLKAMDRFRGNKDSVLVATDVAARGLDVPGIRTVIHYQLPHSAEIYVHRSGRTARASTDGISIALVSPADQAKYLTLCRALLRPEGLQPFPVNMTYFPAIKTRVNLAAKLDKVMRMQSQSKATEAWLVRNAEAMEIDKEASEDEDGQLRTVAGNQNKLGKGGFGQLQVLQKELQAMMCQPLKPKAFSNRFITGAGMTPLLTQQLQSYMIAKSNLEGPATTQGKLDVIGQEQMEPLEALRLTAALTGNKRTYH